MFQNANLCKTVKSYILDAIKGKNTKNAIKNSQGNEIKVFEQTIPRSVKVSEAGLYGKSIIEYMPNNPVSKQYLKIAEQIKEV
jgi:chromosome partitioning protein